MRRCMSKKEANRDTTEIAKPYEPTPEERAAREAVRARRKRTPRLKVSVEGRVANLRVDHQNQSYGQLLLMNALGTSDPCFHEGILTHLAMAATKREGVDECALNFMISVIKDVQPKDQLEAMLAAQMGAVHMLSMEFARRLNSA